MVISFNTGKMQGGGSTALQQKKVTITENGLDVIIPDAGYDGLSTVYVKTEIGGGGSSYKDFSVIGYDDDLSLEMNERIDNDIAYSEAYYNKWSPLKSSLGDLFKNDTDLVYAPAIDTSKVVSFAEQFVGCGNLKYIPMLDYSSNISLSHTFNSCYSLRKIDLSNGNNALYDTTSTFYRCYNLEEVILPTDLSNVKNSYGMFQNCDSIEEVDFTGTGFKPKGIGRIFDGCSKLKCVKGFDTSNATEGAYMFQNCINLIEIPLISFKSSSTTPFSSSSEWSYPFGTNTLTNVTSFEGVVDCEHIINWGTSTTGLFGRLTALKDIKQFDIIKMNAAYSFNITSCTNLTVDSLMVIINALYDYLSDGDTVVRKLQMGSTNLAKLTDEQKAIATSKGWALS